jgi:hypothetical protein
MILQEHVTLWAWQGKKFNMSVDTTNCCFRLWCQISRAVKMTVIEIQMLLMVRCYGFFGDTFGGLSVGG